MEKVTVVTSKTVVIAQTDIDTDQIIPPRFLTTTTRKGLGSACFADWRYDAAGAPKPDFFLTRPEAFGCKILVAGKNFGCGSSREHAPWALLDFGIQAVVSTGIADIFRGNSLKNGLLPVIIDQQTHKFLEDHPGIEITLDVTACELRLPDGRSVAFPMDDFSKYCLVNGVDQLGYLLDQEAAITRFEQSRN